MSKYTPGPWRIISGFRGDTDERWCSIVGADGSRIVAELPDYQHPNLDGCCDDNANLIAAVTELLEALKETNVNLRIMRGNIADAAKADKRWDGMGDVIERWIERNSAAIAKAEGENDDN